MSEHEDCGYTFSEEKCICCEDFHECEKEHEREEMIE